MSTLAKADTLLSSLVDRFGSELVHWHRWFDERDRWVELVHALISQATTLPETQVRKCCEDLVSAQTLGGPESVLSDDAAAQIVAALVREGASSSEAHVALGALQEVALRLELDFAGKLQVVLREAFEQVVERMQAALHIDSLRKV